MNRIILTTIILILLILSSCILGNHYPTQEHFSDAIWVNNDSIIVVYERFSDPGTDSIWIYMVDINNIEDTTTIYIENTGFNSPTRYIENGFYMYYTGYGDVLYYDINFSVLNELSDRVWGSCLRYNIKRNEVLYIEENSRIMRYSLDADTEYMIFDDIDEIYYVDWDKSRLIGGSRDYIVEINFDSLLLDTLASYDDTISIIVNLSDPVIVQDLYDTTRLLMFCQGTNSSNAILTINNTTDRYEFGTVIDKKYFRRNENGDYISIADDVVWIYDKNDEMLVIF